MALQQDAALPDGGTGVGFPHDEDSTKRHNDALSSPATTPLTTSFDTAPFLSFAEQSFTPLSNFDDSFDFQFSDHSKTGSAGRGAREAGGGHPTGPTATKGQSTALEQAPVTTEARVSSACDSRTQRTTISPAPKRASTAMGLGICIDRRQFHESDPNQISPYHLRSSSPDRGGPNNSISAPSAPSAPSVNHRYEPPKTDRPSVFRSTADTASPSSNDALHGHDLGLNAHDTLSSSPLSSSDLPRPLRTGSVQPETQFSQPRPKPIVRTPSEYGSLPLAHPTPELNSRSGAYVGNIAQLEATAVKLSMTSSIDDAIRDLHLELKRTESRRSSLLAASLRANSTDDYSQPGVGQLKRHLSTSSSIVSTNNAARHGGYSPAGFFKSPSHSLTGRLRSSSKNSSGRPEIDLDTVLSRHGPGKASVRSVRSTKLSLAEISEMEPTALTQDILDKADKQVPIKNEDDALPAELRDANMPATDIFHNMMGDADFMDRPAADPRTAKSTSHPPRGEPRRPGSAGSTNTFQQCQDAFGDFDGVHWVPEHAEDPHVPLQEPIAPPPRMPQPKMVRPQSYLDPESGQQMLYYPARVPAMLNLPPKLSNKPKATERNKRQSKVLSVMLDNRQSRVLDHKRSQSELQRDSWLPDPLAGHRESFAALSSDQLAIGDIRTVPPEEPEIQPEPQPAQPEPVPEPDFEGLRRPRRISRMDPENRKSRMSQALPPQLRASAYFDLPSSNGPEIEVKDGSAMATLDSILDASAHAPVGAFTDHNFAGKLGNEVYGKERKRASMAPSAILRTSEEEKGHKKRPSFNWLGKRQSYASLGQDRRDSFSDDGLGPVNADTQATERQALTASDGGSVVIRVDADGSEEEEEEEEDGIPEDDYCGPPTTLLAELQLRKQQQKQRTQLNFPNGMHATLLEMDAVAETERKKRNAKRVNLAWEDVNAQMAEGNSDDEDVPLAIIAARNQGAQNIMDLNRPIGLMEKREMEDNEPLSHRRARLTGQDPRSLMIHKRPSMMDLHHNGSQPPLSPGEILQQEEEEVEETLADRKRRLAAKDEAENPLPRARPVSSVFSAELLSQFGDLDEQKKVKEKAAPKAPAEETLGQRRRRLQAEREARDREMGFSNMANAQPVPGVQRRMNMADVLAAHPRRDVDIRAQESRQHIEHENFLAREREAKMAAIRSQMPTNLVMPSLNRSGGYQSGQFNDGTGGQGPQAAQSSPALHTQVYGQGLQQNRASAVFSNYGVPQQYGSTNNLGVVNNMGYNGMNTLSPYNGGAMNVYAPGMMPPGMQMPLNGGSMDRVEQWRQSVYP